MPKAPRDRSFSVPRRFHVRRPRALRAAASLLCKGGEDGQEGRIEGGKEEDDLCGGKAEQQRA